MPNLWTNDLEFTTHLSPDTFAMADAAVRHTIIHTDHYEMEKCRIPVPFHGGAEWEQTPDGDMEWVYALCRHSVFVALAKAFAATGNASYRETCMVLWDDFLTTQPHTKAREQTSWRSLEAGIRVEHWLRTLELFRLAGSPLPEALTQRIISSIDQHATYLLESHTSFHRMSNWGVIQDHGLLLAGIARDQEAWRKEAIRRLEEELSFQVLPDGVQWEQSPLYHAEVLRCVLDALLICQHASIHLPSGIKEKAYAMAKALDGMTFGKGIIFPQGDSDLLDVRNLRTEAAILFNEPTLFSGEEEETYLDFLSQERASIAGKEPLRPTTSIVASRNGSCCLRKGDFELYFHATALGSGHGHLDAGQADLAFQGKPVMIDSGRYTYTDTPIRIRLKDPAAHNVVETSHDARSQESWSYASLLHVIGFRTAVSPEVDAAECWIRHPDGMLTRRRILLFSHLAVVCDDVYGTEAATLRWHLAASCPCQYHGALWQCGPLSVSLLGKEIPKQMHGETSPEYRQLLPTTVLELPIPPNGHAVTLFSQRPFTATPLPLHCVGDGTSIHETAGYGLSITTEGHTLTMINRREEIIHQVDLVRCGSMEGYGSLLIKQDADQPLCIW